jgi:hypothetical protein
VVPRRAGELILIEAKASRTVRPAMADAVARLSRAAKGRTRGIVVHRGDDAGTGATALRPGVRALPLAKLLDELGR